jgi:parallel beta-helix repeat protein
MRSLKQIEPRTPIASLPIAITECGSYYLTDCVNGSPGANGIVIQTGGVTLDLNGFTMRGGTGSQNGIVITPQATTGGPILVRNGHLKLWGANGIMVVAGTNNVPLSIGDVLLSLNVGSGVVTADGACVTIQNSIAFKNGGDGFAIGFTGLDNGGTIFNSCGESNGGNGFNIRSGIVVNHCTALFNDEHGFRAQGGCNVTGSTARRNDKSGFFSRNSTIVGCVASDNADDGIEVSASSRVENNQCEDNEGAGISVSGVAVRIRKNHIVDNATGLEVAGFEHVIEENVVQENTNNYNVIAGNHRLNILLCEIPESIDWPATVTLAGSLVSEAGEAGITVTSDDVTIDLAGHALIGSVGSPTGIDVAGTSNVVIRNGTIRNWGNNGIRSTGPNGRFDNLRLTGNGGVGAECGAGSQLLACTASGNGGAGYDLAEDTAIVDCISRANGGAGIASGAANLVEKCQVSSNGGFGIEASVRTTVRNCVVTGNTDSGIHAVGTCLVVENNCSDHSAAAGIETIGGFNRIDGNLVTENHTGLDISSSGNLIVRNTVTGSTSNNFDIASNNKVGPVVSVPTSGAVIGNSGGTGVGTTDPWANLSY